MPLTRAGEKAYQLPARSRRVLIGVLLLMLVVLGALWWNATLSQRQADDARAAADARAEKLAAANETLRQQTAAIIKANQRLRAAGEKPVKVPSAPDVGPRGQRGERGPAPTQAEVLAAVTVYCSGGRCSHGPSQAQVSAAVAAYCAGRNQCQGRQGGVGPMGAPGSQGPAGQNATDAQVAAAVATYCSNHGGCQGPKGDLGDQGPKGDTGPAGYPTQFTFTIGPFTYTCTDPDQDHSYECTQQP